MKNARLITEEGIVNADVKIDEGKIIKISPEIPPVGDDVTDLTGMYLMPSAIDGHTHFGSRFLGAKEPIPTADDFSSGSEICLAGGITSIVNFFESSANPIASLKEEISKAEESGVDFSFHFIIKKKDEIPYLKEIFKLGVKSVKVFMAYDSIRLSDFHIMQVMEEVRKLGGVVAVHAENGDMINFLQSMEQGDEPINHARTRPTESEEEAVNRFSSMAFITGVKGYAVHVSSPASLNVIRYWNKKGAKVYAETCPHYLQFNVDAYQRRDGKRFIMSPPLRSEEERKEMISRLNEFYTIGSDYSGFLSKYKDEPTSYKDVPNGVASTEFMLVTIASLMFQGYLDPGSLVSLTSANAIRLYGILNKGLEEGKDADLVVLKREDWKVKEWHGKMDHSIYEGVQFSAKVERTYLRGQLAYEDGDVKGSKGRMLRRK